MIAPFSFAGAPFSSLSAPAAPPSAPTPTVISTSLSSIFAQSPTVTVSTSSTLDGTYTAIPNLYCDRLRLNVAPAIDQASLTWHYGTYMAPGESTFSSVTPLEINGLFVKIEARNWWTTAGFTNLGDWDADANTPTLSDGVGTADTFYTVSEAGTTSLDGIDDWAVGDVLYFDGDAWRRTNHIVWYGIAEVDELSPNGNASGISSGTQRITCYGLLRLAEKKQITTTVIEAKGLTALLSGYSSLGDWDADTNTPPLISSTGSASTYYTVSVAGSTTLDGETDWLVGEILYFNGSTWQRTSGPITINCGLPFNMDQRGETPEHGNRSEQLLDSSADGSFVFAYNERAQSEWSSGTAIKYLMTYQNPFPLDVDIEVTSGSVHWFAKGGVKTDRKTVKAVLDELVPRQRGIGYRIDFDGETLSMKVFSFADRDINMPNGGTFLANQDQYSLDFEQAFDINACTVSNTKTTQYHKIVVEGDWRTTTASFSLADSEYQFEPDWTSDEEDDYFTGATTASWYAGSTDTKRKREANEKVRRSDQFKHVFARFKLSDEWDGTTHHPDTGADVYEVFPEIDLHNANGLITVDATTGEVEKCPTWISGLTVLDHLPLRERYYYHSQNIRDRTWANAVTTGTPTPPFRQPFAFVQTNTPNADDWQMCDQLNATVKNKPSKRRWHVDAKAHHDRPAITLDVHGGGQQFIALSDWNAEALSNDLYEPDDNPNTHHGIDWQDVWVTCTLQTTERTRIERRLSSPVDGEQERVLRVHVEDCRLDYVVPGTIVNIDTGILLSTTDGGYVRDDRERLASFARAAELWYGVERQTLDLSYRQVREIVELGWLITDISSTYKRTNINSVVSAITYDFNAQTTQFETSYADFDLV